MIRIVASLLLIKLSLSLDNITTIESTTKSAPSDDHILCRSCGTIISTSNHIFSYKSPYSQYVFKENIFGKKEVLVQVVQIDVFLSFPVITTEHATCVTIGEWEVSELWFPGYRWKPCMCPECGIYIGWIFELVDYTLISPDSLFYGLMLTNLIGETCNCHFFQFICLFVFTGDVARWISCFKYYNMYFIGIWDWNKE